MLLMTTDSKEGDVEHTDDQGDQVDWKKKRYARGHRLEAMLRDLAAGTLNQQEIADKYDVTQPQISNVYNHPPYRERIELIRKETEDKFSAIWIADKRKRVLEYQQVVEDIEDVLLTDAPVDPILLRTKMAALRSVAEEMAQLPNRVTVQVQRRRVENLLDGVDTDKDLT